MKIKKLLIANRGEIALRILRTAERLGIEVHALYTAGEEGFPHVQAAGQAHFLGSGSLAETYLNQERLLELCRHHHIDAIHPGYGFLSENASFARWVEQAGLIFIGPRAESIEAMGDKTLSKQAMEKIQVPLIPGYHGENQDPDFLAQRAQEIGYPLLIKASAGGGGKGMRLVERPQDFSGALAGAKSEASKAFGSEHVLLEKYVVGPRHIEVQVFGDGQGGAVHLFERECSIQRRHQKIIEESPAPAFSNPRTKEQLCETGAHIARSMNYRGAGTVEFMLDEKERFYFLEMNTRLQVEHPVTERVSGEDLVEWQIRIAQGEGLPKKQEELVQRGHAIECRLYCEDPTQSDLPTGGRLEELQVLPYPNIRWDGGVQAGNVINLDFDPMVAKVISYGSDRMSAIQEMLSFLKDLKLSGVVTNITLLQAVLGHRDFQAGAITTKFLEERPQLRSPGPPTWLKALAAATLEWGVSREGGQVATGGPAPQTSPAPWQELATFRNVRGE